MLNQLLWRYERVFRFPTLDVTMVTRVNVTDIRRPTRIGVGANLMPSLQDGNESSRREAWHQCQK
jgi:hypothetical protein